MHFEVTPFALLAVAAAWISTVTAAFVGPRQRQTPGGRPLFALFVAVAVWSLGAAVELTATGLGAKILWSQVEYLGTLSAPPLFLLFAAEFAGRRWFAGYRRGALLFAVPVATLLLAWTNDSHGLIWTGFSPSRSGGNLLVYEHGPAFWSGVVGYSYLCLAAASALLVWAALRLPRVLRRQAVAVLVAAAIPWTANLIYLLGLLPFTGLDPTPISVAAMGMVCGVAIFRYGLVDLVPEARAAVVREMGDGVLVFDDQDRLIEINPAAAKLLGRFAPRLGQRFAEAFLRWPGLATLPRPRDRRRFEIEPATEASPALEADVSSLAGEQGVRGTIVLLHDTTERLAAERQLVASNRELETQLAQNRSLERLLREQAVRDALTGLFNRRYLDETLPREMARIERTGEPLALVLLDLDHFKRINDLHGHAAGDAVLREVGLLLRAKTRRSDIACRYGGEEFLIAMPGTGLDDAVARAEDLRTSFANRVPCPARVAGACTLSAGVAVLPDHADDLDALLASADLALYAAKAGGRNRVHTPDGAAP